MRLLGLLIVIIATNAFATDQKFNLGEALTLAASCQLKFSSRAYYLNLCPAGMVMVGATPLAGNPTSIQVLCASPEISCE